MLNTAQEDDCCKPLKDRRIAELECWVCKRCGCEWKPEIIGSIRHWKPIVILAVLRIGARE